MIKTIARTLCVLILTSLPTSLVLAADTESEQITAAMELYGQAGKLPMDSSKRVELLSQSEAILKKVIDNNPKSLDAHRKLVGIYLLKQDYHNGIRTMQDAITLSPEDPKLFVALAFLYEHSGAMEYSSAMLEQALELDPHNQLALEYRSVLEQKINARDIEQAHLGEDMQDAHGVPSDEAHRDKNLTH